MSSTPNTLPLCLIVLSIVLFTCSDYNPTKQYKDSILQLLSSYETFQYIDDVNFYCPGYLSNWEYDVDCVGYLAFWKTEINEKTRYGAIVFYEDDFNIDPFIDFYNSSNSPVRMLFINRWTNIEDINLFLKENFGDPIN